MPCTLALILPPQAKQMLLCSSCAREALKLACSKTKTLLMQKAILCNGKRPIGRRSDPKRGTLGAYFVWQAISQHPKTIRIHLQDVQVLFNDACIDRLHATITKCLFVLAAAVLEGHVLLMLLPCRLQHTTFLKTSHLDQASIQQCSR